MEVNVKEESLRGMEIQLEIEDDGTRYFMNRVWVPKFGEVKELVLNEAHRTRYSIHLGADNMYLDLNALYWWPNMKAEIATYVSKCLTRSKVKEEHQRPSRLLQQPKILE